MKSDLDEVIQISQFSRNEQNKVFALAKAEQVILNQIELEYKKKTGMINVRCSGVPGEPMAITNSYYAMLQKQLTTLKRTIKSSVNELKSNFIMKINISEQGEFDLDLVDVTIKIDFPKFENPKSYTVLNSFQESFRVLRPFADYTNSLSVRGHKFRLSVIEADLTLSVEDFIEVIACPIVGPRTEKQWYSFATKVYKEGKKQYNFNVSLPCIDGELIWDIKEKKIFLQHQELF
ncbi:hypothetical protein MKZ20_21615 [Psychrobacillus sp. FSL K6-2684]|uniref:hypothetical protein n=1 Tax=unclassified Psychrobacillus TaxID=2636677 RepID=UPI0030FBDEE2